MMYGIPFGQTLVPNRRRYLKVTHTTTNHCGSGRSSGVGTVGSFSSIQYSHSKNAPSALCFMLCPYLLRTICLMSSEERLSGTCAICLSVPFRKWDRG